MAHFAELDADNVVIRVIVVTTDNCLDGGGEESEAAGQSFCTNLLGGTWVQTSYNARIRKNYASIGHTYDAGRDAFIPPQPYLSWTLNENICTWQAPIPKPEDGKPYVWDEAQGAWIEVLP